MSSQHALSTCSRIMLEHPTGAMLNGMRPQMHGRTDARTNADRPSPTATNSLVGDAHARIRSFDRVEVGEVATARKLAGDRGGI